MTARTTMPSDKIFWDSLHQLHGHRCPMSILGARLGLAARAALGPQTPGVHFAARFYHRTCAIDGIQLATNCTLGNNNIEIEPKGDHHLTLRVQETGKTSSARLTEAALEIGRAYGDLRKRVQGLDDQFPEAETVKREMEEVLHRLEAAPQALLVEVLTLAD